MKVAIVNCFDTFLERERALLRFFQERGDTVTAFLSDFQHVQKSYRTDTPKDITLVHVSEYRKNLSLQRVSSHMNFSNQMVKLLEEQQWDLLWVIVPPNSLVKSCARFRRKHPQTKLVFDINDLWPESFPVGSVKKLLPFQIWRRYRDSFLPEADYIITECSLFQHRLLTLKNKKCRTIYLCKQNEPINPDPSAQRSLDSYELCYLGSINHIIDIDAICAIISQLFQMKPVQLHIIGTGESKNELIKRVQAAGASVIDHGSVYDEAKKQEIFDRCHFGLNVMKSSVCVGMTMKSLDYLAGGLPLINNIPGDTWELIEQYDFGINWSHDRPINPGEFQSSQARASARRFFEQELSYKAFSLRVSSVIKEI